MPKQTETPPSPQSVTQSTQKDTTALIDQLTPVIQKRIRPNSRITKLSRLTGGASAETYRVEIETLGKPSVLALRLSRRDVPHLTDPLKTESILIQEAAKVGVPVPQIYTDLIPKDGIGHGFLMEWLEGEALGQRIVRHERFTQVRGSLAYQFGATLARIHSIDFSQKHLASRLNTITATEHIHQTMANYASLESSHPMIDYTAQWLLKNLPQEEPQALVHGDYRNGNVMIDESGIVGVLDWELASVGDPMKDLGWLCCNSWRFGKSELPVGGFGKREDLFAGYESISGSKVNPEHVKFWEVYGSFWWSTVCLTMTARYRLGEDANVERISIGKRSSESQIDCVNNLIPGPIPHFAGEHSQNRESQNHGKLNPTTTAEASIDDEELAPEADFEDMPGWEELLTAIEHFLRDDVRQSQDQRLSYLSRVASNSLKIVKRDLTLGPTARKIELHSLKKLLSTKDASLGTLRTALATALRNGKLDLNDKALQVHLRQTVANQIAIDQPGYSGLKTALENASE